MGFPKAESQMASGPLKNKTPQEVDTCWEHHPGENPHLHLAITVKNEKIDLGRSILSQGRRRFPDVLWVVVAQGICLWLKGTVRLLKTLGNNLPCIKHYVNFTSLFLCRVSSAARSLLITGPTLQRLVVSWKCHLSRYTNKARTTSKY